MEAEKATDVAADDAKYQGFWNIKEAPSITGCWEYRGGTWVLFWDGDGGRVKSAYTPDALKVHIDNGELVPSQWLPPHARQPEPAQPTGWIDAAKEKPQKFVRVILWRKLPCVTEEDNTGYPTLGGFNGDDWFGYLFSQHKDPVAFWHPMPGPPPGERG